MGESVEREGRVGRFWNWLPHFRAVAETLHLPTAAERVHVSPPALSRTLRLLEEEVGYPLFHRRRGRLVLTDDGRKLLDAVQSAMRTIDDAERVFGGRSVVGPVVVAAGGVSVPMVMRAFLRLRDRWPGVEPRLSTPQPDRVVEQLWAGELDLVVASFARYDEGLTTEVLGYERSSIYCGPAHPLYGSTDVTLQAVRDHPFTAPPSLPDGTSPEGWPVGVPRHVAFEVDRIALGVDVCAGTALLAVLPDSIAGACPVPLHRLPIDGVIPETPIVAHCVTGNANLAVKHLLDEVRLEVPFAARNEVNAQTG